MRKVPCGRVFVKEDNQKESSKQFLKFLSLFEKIEKMGK